MKKEGLVLVEAKNGTELKREKPREKPREKDAKELNENNYNGHLASIIIYSYIYIYYD